MNNKIKSDIMLSTNNLEVDKMTFDAIKYDNQYKREHYVRVALLLKKDFYPELEKALEKTKMSKNAFITEAVKEKIEKLNNK